MKVAEIVQAEKTNITKTGKLSLTDFLNYAIQSGHDVRKDQQHWINEYMNYASSWKESHQKDF